jgi:hypothetical protein
MPPRESTSRRERTNVYSVLLVVSAAFLLLAVLITVSELRSGYHFMGTETLKVPKDGVEQPTEPTEPTEPVTAPAE